MLALLLTFFYRQMPGLIRGGHVYLAMPPLFRIDHGKETHWALDEKERDKIVASLPKNAKVEISRFKGLGEMPAEELKSTTLDKNRRRAVRVAIDSELETDKILNELMGKDTQARFRFIMERARETSAEELDV
jgi:DNA gyrase subunit B